MYAVNIFSISAVLLYKYYLFLDKNHYVGCVKWLHINTLPFSVKWKTDKTLMEKHFGVKDTNILPKCVTALNYLQSILPT